MRSLLICDQFANIVRPND